MLILKCILGNIAEEQLGSFIWFWIGDEVTDKGGQLENVMEESTSSGAF